MSPIRSKLLTGLLSTSVALAAAVLYWNTRERSYVRVVDHRAAAEELLLARQLSPRGLDPVTLGVDPAARLRREPMTAAVVNEVFALGGSLAFDEHCFYRYAPNYQTRIEIKGYPGGSFVRTTNSTGEREDHDVLVEEPDDFVLVAGDSHTDGMCLNPETYANQLEARLRAARPGRTVEVLNTGVAGYSFYNYLGVLERYLPRDPDVFVTGCYGGNDFVEVLRPYHYFNRSVSPPQSIRYWDELEKARGVGIDAMTQVLNQALYLERYPDQIDVALKASTQVCDEIARICEERGIEWIFVYIPTAFDGDWPLFAPWRARASAALERGEASLEVADRIVDRLLPHVRALGIRVIDLREHFDREGGPWHWEEMHINLAAHRRIAELLETPVAEALARRALVPGGIAR